MTSAVVVRPAASREVAEAHAYHAQYGRGDAFMTAVDQVMARIAEHPLMFPVVHEGVRRALLHRFAYSVFFVVDGDAAVVLALQHQRRDPSLRPKP